MNRYAIHINSHTNSEMSPVAQNRTDIIIEDTTLWEAVKRAQTALFFIFSHDVVVDAIVVTDLPNEEEPIEETPTCKHSVYSLG